MKRQSQILLICFLLVFCAVNSAFATNMQYSYDNLNRLTKIDYGDGRVINYTYDQDGNRIAQAVNAAGSLTVTIAPQAAIDALAQWRVDTGAWQSSGATISDLSIGQHTVYFSDISGWTTPISQSVSISDGQTSFTSGTYVQQLASVSSFQIARGAATTSSRTVTLNNTATGSPTYYMASESSDFSGATWLTYSAAPSFTLSAGGGTKTVYFKVKNSAGESAPVSDSIRLIAPPAVTSFLIDNGGAASTPTPKVTLNNTCSETPTQYMASESSSFSGAVWETYSKAPSFTLSATNGTKTVYFKVKGSTGISTPVSASIILAQLPTVTSFKINKGAASTITQTVTLNNTATISPTQFMACEYSDFRDGGWQTYSTAPSFTLSTGSGTKTVYFKVKNSAGECIAASSDTIQLIVRPTVATFQINNGDASTSSRKVTLNNTVTDSPTQYMASQSPSFIGATWKAYAGAPTFTLSLGNGTKTVYFKVKNAAGASTVVSDTITLTVPTALDGN